MASTIARGLQGRGWHARISRYHPLVRSRHPSRRDAWPDELDPGPAEWAVLEILWRHGPCSASFVEKALADSGRWSGAGAPALLARLIASRLARYEDRRRRPMHVQAAVSKTALQEELCRRFARRHFAGDLKVLARTVQRHALMLRGASASADAWGRGVAKPELLRSVFIRIVRRRGCRCLARARAGRCGRGLVCRTATRHQGCARPDLRPWRLAKYPAPCRLWRL